MPTIVQIGKLNKFDMKQEYNIEEVNAGDIIDFKTPVNKATSPAKAVDSIRRMVKLNFFEGPELAIDKVNKWVSFNDIFIIKKAN